MTLGGPIAIPLAYASHFVCDALPHFGIPSEDRVSRRSHFLRAVAVDGVVLIAISIIAITYGLPWYVYASMIAAITPDFFWIYIYVFKEKMGKLEPKPLRFPNVWHAKIQTMETINGLWFEVAWFVAMCLIIYRLV